MSSYLKQIAGDEDEYYDEEEEDYDDSEEVSQDEEEDEEIINEEDDDSEEVVEQTKANLTIKNHSERKQELKQNKHTKSKIVSNSSSNNNNNNSSTDQKEVYEISEELLQYYQLKLYGVNGPTKKAEKEELNEEINFKLDVLQSSKMFFENVQPTLVTIYSGTKAYANQAEYIQQNFSKLMREKGYRTNDELWAAELTQQRLVMDNLPHSKIMEYVQQIMNRTEHLTCLSSDSKYFYIYGGKQKSTICDDFIQYEIQSGKLNVYNNLKYVQLPSRGRVVIPPLFGGGMFEHDGKIYIIGKGDAYTCAYIYTIEYPKDPARINYGLSTGYPFSPSIYFNKIFENRLYFTFHHFCESNVLKVYLFGGKCAQKAMDDMIIIQIPIQNTYLQAVSYTVQLKPKVGDWPCARYGHSSCQTQQDASNSLFRFDIIDKKWYLMEVISDERNVKLSSHQCFTIGSKLYILGGNAEQEKSKSKSHFNALLNLNDPGKPIPICNYLTTKRREGYLCDIVFRVKDVGSETTSHILAHRCILKARCPYLADKLTNCTETMSIHNFEGTFLDQEIGVVDLTECHTHIFEKYLEFLYTGSLYLESSEVVSQFLEFVKQISMERHYPFIQKICSLDSRKDLGLTKQILAEMHHDFTSLIDDNTYSDLAVVLDQESVFERPPTDTHEEDLNEEFLSSLASSNIPSSGISVHRLIMSRSPFFSRMFVTSGMMETREKVVHLNDYSKEVMIDLLKYLYTDIIQLSSRNCLGILVYSLMFDLTDLASCCRRMVVSLIDNSTVWVVHEISMLYSDKTLENECEHYIANNFVSLNSRSTFLELPDMTRIRIKQLYERKYIKKTK